MVDFTSSPAHSVLPDNDKQTRFAVCEGGSPRAQSKNPPMIEQCGGKEKEIEEEKWKMPEGEMAAAYIRPL